jgi:hypothetical protein
LLDGRLRRRLAEFFDIAGNDDRRDPFQRDAAVATPPAEPGDRAGVGPPGVPVPDFGGEELDEPPACPLTRLGDQRGEGTGGPGVQLTRAGEDDVVSDARRGVYKGGARWEKAVG